MAGIRFWGNVVGEGREGNPGTSDRQCGAYVDLNPIRASIVPTPEKSDFTSVQERIADLETADEVTTVGSRDVGIKHTRKAG